MGGVIVLQDVVAVDGSSRLVSMSMRFFAPIAFLDGKITGVRFVRAFDSFGNYEILFTGTNCIARESGHVQHPPPPSPK
jgi:hypothetical protein